VPIRKEARALLLPWLVCVSVLIAVAVTGSVGREIAILAFCLGAAAVGALSIGHEYTDRTLSLMLSLPVPRVRQLLIKQIVLGVLLLALGLIANAITVWVADVRVLRIPAWVFALPLLYAFFLAPWLTMVCRNPIAGAVFTTALPAILWVASEWPGALLDSRGPEMAAFRQSLFWYGSLVLCAIGFYATWRMFLALEAIEGPVANVALPRWLAPAADRRSGHRVASRSRVAHLVTKELHLQQLPILLGVLNLVAWLGLTIALADSPLLDAFTAINVFVAVLMAIVIGATASAGERELGTVEWQVLMPVATWVQWTVKVGVAVSLALLLALVLPAAYAYLHQGVSARQLLQPARLLGVILLTVGGVYVSSLCRTALWALLASLVTAVGAAMYLQIVVMSFVGPQFLFFSQRMVFPIAVLIAMMLWFGHANHRSADRPVHRVWMQAMTIVAGFSAVVMILSRAI
jgi:hypothetical protein